MLRGMLRAGALTLLALASAARAAAAAHGSPDVVLVTIDTLRWDAVGFAGRTPSPTPALDRLAAAGRIFTDAHAHNVVTLPSHVNLLTGLYPYQHGVRDNSGFRVPVEAPTLATALAAAGYATGAFVGAYPLDSEFGLDRGFEVYDDRYPKGSQPEDLVMPERRGDEVVAAALAWWRAAGARPRFLWVHLYDPHAPYEPPEPFASRFRGDSYLGEVAAADVYVAPLLEALSAPGRRPVIVAVTADHGEALGDHGERTHGLFAYESTLKVPLVIWGAGIVAGRDGRAARHVDLFPTLLEAAGAAVPPSPLGERPGRSLLAPAPERGAETYFEALSAALNRGWAPLRGLIADGRKAISLPIPELYELAGDPLERVNLAQRERRAWSAGLARLPSESRWPPARRPAEGEEARALAALGYLSGTDRGRRSFGAEDDPKRLLGLDEQIYRVTELYRDRDLEAAVRSARAIVAARPGMPLGHSLLAQALLESGERAEALRAMEAARTSGAATDGLLLQLGLTLAEAGRADEAVGLLRPLALRGEARFSNALGVALSEAGRLEAAEVELLHALELDPEHAKAWENLALVALRRGDLALARARAERALALNPALPLAWNDLGVARFGLGEKSAALDAWARAVELEPRLWDAQWNLGVQGAALGRTAAARDALAAFVAGAPKERYGRDIEQARALLRGLAVE
jgi:arylsulfatase A-like enzyme/Flp pilus assembly protein TadD